MNATIFMLRVTAGARDVARVSVRHQQFPVGRPIEFDEATPRIAAIEYALGAVGGEVVNGLRTFAWRRRVPIDAIEAIVTGELENGLTYLEVIGEHGRPAIGRIHVKLFVSAPDEAATRCLFDEVVDKLPLVGTLRLATRLTTELIVTA
jgi:hypothetical protein